MGAVRNFDGTEWEDWIQSLLLLHYAPGDFHVVPDRDGGDFGIDGFSQDGTVYQCYAAEEPRSVEELYEVQRDKLTRDIKKFIDNRAGVAALLGSVKVRRWLLVVPRHDSNKLLAHARAKEGSVRDAGLPYVADDFSIAVITDQKFAVEAERLGAVRVRRPILTAGDVEAHRERWRESPNQPVLRANLRRKASHVFGGKAELESRFEGEMIKSYVDGQAALEDLRERMPAVFAEVNNVKLATEARLATQSLLSEATPKRHLRELLWEVKTGLRTTVPALQEVDATRLADEAVADWLLRCPLDFDAPE